MSLKTEKLHIGIDLGFDSEVGAYTSIGQMNHNNKLNGLGFKIFHYTAPGFLIGQFQDGELFDGLEVSYYPSEAIRHAHGYSVYRKRKNVYIDEPILAYIPNERNTFFHEEKISSVRSIHDSQGIQWPVNFGLLICNSFIFYGKYERASRNGGFGNFELSIPYGEGLLANIGAQSKIYKCGILDQFNLHGEGAVFIDQKRSGKYYIGEFAYDVLNGYGEELIDLFGYQGDREGIETINLGYFSRGNYIGKEKDIY